MEGQNHLILGLIPFPFFSAIVLFKNQQFPQGFFSGCLERRKVTPRFIGLLVTIGASIKDSTTPHTVRHRLNARDETIPPRPIQLRLEAQPQQRQQQRPVPLVSATPCFATKYSWVCLKFREPPKLVPLGSPLNNPSTGCQQETGPCVWSSRVCSLKCAREYEFARASVLVRVCSRKSARASLRAQFAARVLSRILFCMCSRATCSARSVLQLALVQAYACKRSSVLAQVRASELRQVRSWKRSCSSAVWLEEPFGMLLKQKGGSSLFEAQYPCCLLC